MKCKYVYGILSSIEDIFEVTSSRAYQVNWSIDHLVTGNNFLGCIDPKFEHELTLCKFENEEDVNDDEEFSK